MVWASPPARNTWDAENRLSAVEPAGTPGPGDVKVTFGYDYQNRRIWKKVFAWDPNSGPSGDWEATPSVHRKFVWFNWLMLLELDGSDDSVVRRFKKWLAGSAPHPPILQHECCHACDQIDKGFCQYLAGAVFDDCSKRAKQATPDF